MRDSARNRTLEAFTPYGTGGASSRVRLFQWLNHTGIPATVYSYAGFGNNRPRQLLAHVPSVIAAEARTRLRCRRMHDRVLIHRGMTPFSNGGAIASVAARAQFAVYDFDDALMDLSSGGISAMWSQSRVVRRAVASVDRVIAGSDYLADWASGHNRDVRLIPTCIAPDDYAAKKDFSIHAAPRLVWLGSPSTESYLRSIEAPLLALHRLLGCRVTVISAGRASLGGLDSIVDRLDWKLGIERSLSDYDIALAPLVDGPWERGKCAYKVLQYAASGLPAVVSPVGANRTAAGVLGYPVAETPNAWMDALVDLLSARDVERERIGTLAQASVLEHYSYERWATVWLDAVGESNIETQAT